MTHFPTHEHAVINVNHLRDEHQRHAEQRRLIRLAMDVAEPATPRWFEYARARRRALAYVVKAVLSAARAAFRVPGEPTRGPPGAGSATHDGLTANSFDSPRNPARVTSLQPAGAKRQADRTREGTGGASNPVTTLGYAVRTSSLPLVS